MSEKKAVTVTFTYTPSDLYPEELTTNYLKQRLECGLYIRNLTIKDIGIHKKRYSE